jgi:hypothetical protein
MSGWRCELEWKAAKVALIPFCFSACSFLFHLQLMDCQCQLDWQAARHSSVQSPMHREANQTVVVRYVHYRVPAYRRSGWLSVLRRCLPRRWPGFDSWSRPDLRLEWNRWLCVRGHVLKRCNWDYKMGWKICSSQSEGVPHLEAWVRVGRGIPHFKGPNNILRLFIPKNKCVKKEYQHRDRSLPFRNTRINTRIHTKILEY